MEHPQNCGRPKTLERPSAYVRGLNPGAKITQNQGLATRTDYSRGQNGQIQQFIFAVHPPLNCATGLHQALAVV